MSSARRDGDRAFAACCNNAPDRLCLTPFLASTGDGEGPVQRRFASRCNHSSASVGHIPLQAVTEKDLYNDICNAPLDFESSPWDSLSGRPLCAGLAGAGRTESLKRT